MKLKSFCPSALKPFINKITATKIGYRLALGTFWAIAGAVISRGLMLIATILVARILGKANYGELGMIQSTIGMFGTFAGFGLGLTATKHVAEFRKSDPGRAGRIIGLSGMVAIITGGIITLSLLIFAPWLADHTINAPHLTDNLRIGALILFFNALNGAQTGALSGFEAFRPIAYINLFVGLISFPTLILGAYWGGLTGAVWGLAINHLISWLLNHIVLRKQAKRFNVPISIRNCSREIPILISFSLPAVLSGVLVGPVKWMCNALLVNSPGGYEEMGLFTAALVFQNLLLFVSGMLNAPLLSILSNTGSAKSQKLETTNILSSWSIGLLPAFLLLLFPEIVETLFGGQYKGHEFKTTFAIVVFYTCILTYRGGLLRVLQSQSLIWLGLFNNLLWVSVLLPVSFFLVKWGAVGMAASFAIAYAFISIVFMPVYIKKCKVPKNLLISKESLVIWIIVISLVATVFWEIAIIYRILATPIVYIIAALMLKKIWIRNSNSPITNLHKHRTAEDLVI